MQNGFGNISSYTVDVRIVERFSTTTFVSTFSHVRDVRRRENSYVQEV